MAHNNLDKKPVGWLLGVCGAALVTFGFVVTATGAGIFRYLRKPFALVLIAAVAGYAFFKNSSNRRDPPPETLPPVNRIMRLAREHKGRLTVAEVLAETSLTLADAQKTLDELAFSGACQLIVGDKGLQIYYFAEFENEAHKDSDALNERKPQGNKHTT